MSTLIFIILYFYFRQFCRKREGEAETSPLFSIAIVTVAYEAALTARAAITEIRFARYSAEA